MNLINKKILLAAAVMACNVCFAADYDTMVFECSDGSTRTINAANVSIEIKDNLLTASNGSETLELTAKDVTRFYFANAGAVEVSIEDGASVTAYSVSGVEMGTFQSLDELRSQLTPGVYVVKSGNQTLKIQVK